MSEEITESIARRVLEVVDAGLVAGIGEPVPGAMCVEAAVCYALGLPHSAAPPCVAPSVNRLKVILNDARWSSPRARARGMRRLAVASLGSTGALDEGEFVDRVTRLAIQHCVPVALRAAAQCRAGAQRERLLQAAALCEREPTREHAREARDAAAAAVADAAADAHAVARAATAQDADALAVATDIATACAYGAAATADAYAVARAADAARAAADQDADAAALAAARAAYAAARVAYLSTYDDAYAACAYGAAAARAAYADARAADAAKAVTDAHLSDFAEGVVQVLIDLDAPGCAYLHLTESAT